MTAATYPPDRTPTPLQAEIWLDTRGVAWVGDTNTKVLEIVLDKLAHDWSPEEIQRQHPHLTLAEIHAAFAFYYEHQEDMDGQIQARQAQAQRLQQAAGDDPFTARMRAEGRLPPLERS